MFLVVRQPNGYFAKWSEKTDSFNHMNCNSIEMVEICIREHKMSKSKAVSEVHDAIRDVGSRRFDKKDGLNRWRECLLEIEKDQGIDEVETVVAICSSKEKSEMVQL